MRGGNNEVPTRTGHVWTELKEAGEEALCRVWEQDFVLCKNREHPPLRTAI